MKTATFVRKVDWHGDAALYKLSEPVSFRTVNNDDDQTTGYVIASSIIAFDHGGRECMIFPAKENGETWGMLDIAGLRGTLCHVKTFKTIGFEVVE